MIDKLIHAIENLQDEDGDKLINQVIKPAFDEYLNYFLDLVTNAKRISPERSSNLLNGQKKYMRYRAEKDPAKGMLKGFFGHIWTEMDNFSIEFV